MKTNKLMGKYFIIILSISIFTIVGYITLPGNGIEKRTGTKMIQNSDNMNNPKPQNKKERNYEKVYFKKEFTITGGKNYSFPGPLGIKTDKNNNIYIFDWIDFSVYKYSTKGEFIRKYGRGKDHSGESVSYRPDFCISSTEDVWIYDPMIKEICIYDKNGNVKNQIKPEDDFRRIVAQNDGGYVMVLSFPPTKSSFFVSYDRYKKCKNYFGQISDNQPKYLIVMDGFLSNDYKDDIYYAFLYMGWVISYHPDGKLKFFAETMDKVAIPEVNYFDDGISKAANIGPNTPFVNAAIDIANSRMYIYSWLSSKRENATIIDIYNSADGMYISSYRINEKCIFVCVSGKNIYTSDMKTLTKWKIVKK